ncbi:threonine synthase [Clostridium sp. MCC353]|uniref:threonine synthase n=1 Tax=Clostridium sp. MCC353 TaxID=2592646 RepID=UPI001C0335A6|nr:threonine synthase [Clostridium sp. MCC353]MBT9779440.1 threonine synthase [Clostridium sp. MCC353]
MKVKGLQCVVCGRLHTGGIYPPDLYECAECGGLLQAVYEDTGKTVGDIRELTDPSLPGIWKYKKMLPLEHGENIVSLGEGNTALVQAKRIYEGLGMKNLFIKNEFSNPTASFKDRPTAVGISVAKERGADVVAVASSGNAGVSVAAYAAKAGMRCLACVPKKTSPGKVKQLMAYGASVTFARGGYSECFGIVREACKKYGYANLTSTYVNPYTVEGDKTVAYEIYEQTGKMVPDWITVPIGTGPLLSGVYRGFQELKQMGLVSKLPRMLGVQAENCSPIVRGYIRPDGKVEAWDGVLDTMAGGIADQLVGYEGDGEYTIRLVRESGGCMTSLTEEEIREVWQELSRKEGVFAEPTGAAAVGAVKKMRLQGVIGPSDLIVALVTGHGLKAAHYIEADTSQIPVISRPEELI